MPLIHLKIGYCHKTITMLPFEQSKKILNRYGHNYTDEEINLIRDFISVLTDIDYNLFLRKQEEEFLKKKELKIVQLNIDQNETKSDPIHSSEHRRAG